jgi:hydroxymethylglutaryl-CoA lyase
MHLPDRVHIVEVGPRDGLQNEAQPIAAEAKVRFIHALAEAGLTQIEATSFVHPKAVPQLADATEVLGALDAREGVTYSALVPNLKGLSRAREADVRRIAVFTAASETFTQRNINMTIDQSLAIFRDVVREARTLGMSVRGYVSTAFVCPYEGDVDPARVVDITRQLFEMGVDEVAISDTIGAAAPSDVHDLFGRLLAHLSVNQLALHLHDTYGTALANVMAGLDVGVTTFDAAAGGLGGCPYAPGASGNLATEDLVYFLDRMGMTTGVSLAGVVAAEAITRPLGATPRSHQWQRLRGCQQRDGASDPVHD